MLHGRALYGYVRDFTAGGERKIRSGKLQYRFFSFEYDLIIIISTSVLQS
jgi:hypothetical protein